MLPSTTKKTNLAILLQPKSTTEANEAGAESTKEHQSIEEETFESSPRKAEDDQPEQREQQTNEIINQVDDDELDEQEVESIEVELVKDKKGLGITIAGYVCEKEDISGIYVKSIAPGSSADLSGKIQLNDQIIEVDGISLLEFSNHEAVEVLRKTDKVVKIKLARYLKGGRFDRLQLAINNANFDNVRPLVQTKPNQTILHVNSEQHKSYDTIDKDAVFKSETEVALSNLEKIKDYWQSQLGDDYEIVVASFSKFEENGGLGISLEGTIEEEDGKEAKPHHYVESILPQGPVGLNE